MATLLASKPASASEPSLWPLCSDAAARPGCRNPSCMASGAVPAVSGEARASRSCLCFGCAGLSVAAAAAGLPATSLSHVHGCMYFTWRGGGWCDMACVHHELREGEKGGAGGMKVQQHCTPQGIEA